MVHAVNEQIISKMEKTFTYKYKICFSGNVRLQNKRAARNKQNARISDNAKVTGNRVRENAENSDTAEVTGNRVEENAENSDTAKVTGSRVRRIWLNAPGLAQGVSDQKHKWPGGLREALSIED